MVKEGPEREYRFEVCARTSGRSLDTAVYIILLDLQRPPRVAHTHAGCPSEFCAACRPVDGQIGVVVKLTQPYLKSTLACRNISESSSMLLLRYQ